ncbi:TFIIB-type zinc ribbon-containing protein [Larkinella harenae]
MQSPSELSDLVRAPCKTCGAQLKFSAEKQKLSCDYCGNTEDITFTKNNLHESPLAFRVEDRQLLNAPTEEKRLFTCQSCGAKTTVNFDTPTITCAFCGSKNVNPDAQKTRLIEPAGVLPFRIAKEQALQRFKHWVGDSWLAPSDLAAGARLDNLHGIYIPFWTFDAQAYSTYSGEAGFYYYVPVQVRDANGKLVTQQQQRVRWEYRSGSHEAFYDDLLEMASRKLSAQESQVQEASRFNLQEVVDYDPRIMLGWEAEVYSIDLQESARKAEEQIRNREENACASKMGGDTQRNLNVDTRLTNQTFKHILLPLWICMYVYNGKQFRFLVNGQTGQIAGQRPASAWKVALLVFGFLLLVLFFYWLGKR